MDHTDMKKTFSQALIDLVRTGDNIAVVDADLMRIVGSQRFRDTYPERYYQVGIAEQDMVGTAAGLAIMGRTVFATTFTNFISLRAADQICNTVCYNNLNVKVCGIYAGLTSEKNGGTHISVEDVTIFRGMPNMRIIDPGDGNEFYQAMCAAARMPGPFYIRISKGPMMPILPKGYQFQFGKAVILSEGTDATLITSGLTTAFGVEACIMLREAGIYIRHIHMPTIKPIDRDAVIRAAQETGMLFVAENQSIVGGLGSAVAETVCDSFPVRVKRLGVTDEFCVGASVAHLSAQYDIDAQGIVKQIRFALRK